MVDFSDKASEFNAVADRLRAMGHPTRLMILYLLSQESLHVGDIAERLGCSIAVVSYHLKAMERCQLLRSEREGRHVAYVIEWPIAKDLCGAICRQLTRGGQNGGENPPERDVDRNKLSGESAKRPRLNEAGFFDPQRNV